MKRFIIALLLCACLCSCAKEYSKEEILNDKKRIVYVYSSSDINIIMDMETGVEYILYTGAYCAAITPTYNADGTLKVNKYFKEEWK